MTLAEVFAYWPHASMLAAGLVAKPGYARARAAFVLMCRAVVAHEDGDDKAALKDIVQAVAVSPIRAGELVERVRAVPPPIPVTALPTTTNTEIPGTVSAWPK